MVPPGTYRSHTDRFLQSVDLKEIRAKQVFNPYVKWPFWHRERAISRVVCVRLPLFHHGSIALSVLFKIGVSGFSTFLTPKPPKMTGIWAKKVKKNAKRVKNGTKITQKGPKTASKWGQNDAKTSLNDAKKMPK